MPVGEENRQVVAVKSQHLGDEFEKKIVFFPGRSPKFWFSFGKLVWCKFDIS